MERIEHALKNGGSLKAVKRRLGTGKNEIYALSKKEGYVTANMDNIGKVAEEFHRDLYSSQDNLEDNGKGNGQEELNIPLITTEEVNKASKEGQKGKAAQYQLRADLLKESVQTVLEKPATLYDMPHFFRHTRILEEF